MIYNTLTNKSANWPKGLDNTKPLITKLNFSGNIPSSPRLGVIGTRRPTSYGRQVVEQLVEPLARAGIVIVSGLAIGIDGLAHQHALQVRGKTIAILPSSLDRIYPARHQSMAQRICNNGALVSEYQLGTKAEKSYFIARNRIIAAFSDVLLVIEAAEKSGTMHTVDFALQLGKDVAAVPGPITSLFSKGTNRLIKHGATPITSPQDIFELLGVEPQFIKPINLNLNDAETHIYVQLGRQSQNFSQLLSNLELNEKQLRISLTNLEMENLVAQSSNGMYARR